MCKKRGKKKGIQKAQHFHGPNVLKQKRVKDGKNGNPNDHGMRMVMGALYMCVSW